MHSRLSTVKLYHSPVYYIEYTTDHTTGTYDDYYEH